MIKTEETAILALGNIDMGFSFVGPFASFSKAVEFEETYGDNLSRSGWISRVTTPAVNDDTKETIDQIYDTIMGNVGMSPHHVIFDLNYVSQPEVDAQHGIVKFKYRERYYKMILMEE